MRSYRSQVQIQKDSTGQEFCYLGGPPSGYDGGIHGDNCDVPLCDRGIITLSVLSLFGKTCPLEVLEQVQAACKRVEITLSKYL